MPTRTGRTHAEITTLILYMLQDSSAATYDSTETEYWIEESLKEFATYSPNIVPMLFKIESRGGTDTAGGTSVLTDTTKSQFTETDDEANARLLWQGEKVVHNTTENTWAVVNIATAITTSVMTLHANIMNSGDNYEIYNKRCWNKRQIWIGDVLAADGIAHVSVPSYLWIDSVEYPIGTKRNWKVYGDVLELDVYDSAIQDSDPTLDPPRDVNVLVRFAMPHRLCQSTDLEGAIKTEGAAGSVAIVADGFTSGQIAGVGDEFYVENHKALYTCTEQVTWATEGVVLYFYPPLEAVGIEDDFINFTRSTLRPHHEELFCHLVAARAVLSDNINYINEINKGGEGVYTRYREWGERKLGEVLDKLERLSPPRTKRTYPRD